jgi:hypothetical protein
MLHTVYLPTDLEDGLHPHDAIWSVLSSMAEELSGGIRAGVMAPALASKYLPIAVACLATYFGSKLIPGDDRSRRRC